jgi:hypothetical protein
MSPTGHLQNYKPQIHLLCQCYFLGTYGGYLKANSFTESENSAVKRDPMGPKPNMGIDRSQQAIQAHETKRIVELATKARHSLSQTEVMDDCDDSHQELSKLLNASALKDLFSEHNTRQSCQRHKVSQTLFYVRRSHWSKLDTNPESRDYWKSVVATKFDRTRLVSSQKSKLNVKYPNFKYPNIQMSKCPRIRMSNI